MNNLSEINQLIETISRDSLFGQLTGNDLARLIPHTQILTIKSGNPVVTAGQPAENLYILQSGKLKYAPKIGVIFAGNPTRVGDESIIGLANYLTSVIADSNSAIIRIPSEQVREQLVKYPFLTTQATEELFKSVTNTSENKPPSIVKLNNKNAESFKTIGWIISIVLPLVILIMMLFAEAPIKITYFSVLLITAACLWVFSLVDEFIPPLFVLSSTIALAITPANIALKGFGSEALFLFVGVYGLSIVIEDSGIFYRFMLALLSRFPDSSFWQSFLLVFSGYLISPVISSGNSRVSMLIPLYREMMECLSIKKKSLAATSLATATFSGAMLMSPMFLTSKPSNLVVIGLLPGDTKEQFSSFYWFYAALIPAIFVTIAHFVADKIVFGKFQPSPIPREILRKQLELLGPLSDMEWSASICLVFFIGGAATSQWHHLTLSQISSLLLVGLLTYGLVKKKSFQNRIDWSMIFFLLSLDGLTAIMNYLKFNEYLLAHTPNFLPYLQDHNTLVVVFVCAVVLTIRLALPTTAGMITSALLLVPLAPALGVSAWIIGFLASLFSDIWFFPYQSSPYTQFRNKEGGKEGRYDEQKFRFHNYILNSARLFAALLSIPYWTWLGLL